MMKSLELLDAEVSTEQSRDLINRVQLLEANVQSVLDTDYSILIPVYETACEICTVNEEENPEAVYSCSFCNYYKELNKEEK